MTVFKKAQDAKGSWMALYETEKQRLAREAWRRYEAAHPLPQVVPPIGDIENRIFAALCEEFNK